MGKYFGFLKWLLSVCVCTMTLAPYFGVLVAETLILAACCTFVASMERYAEESNQHTNIGILAVFSALLGLFILHELFRSMKAKSGKEAAGTFLLWSHLFFWILALCFCVTGRALRHRSVTVFHVVMWGMARWRGLHIHFRPNSTHPYFLC